MKKIFLILIGLIIACDVAFADEQTIVSETVVVSEDGRTVAYSDSGKWSDGWLRGENGYITATEEYDKTDKAMLVYMSTSWCPYCRSFEKKVLSNPEVHEFLRDKIKVLINPELTEGEATIAEHYRLRGIPAFYMHPPKSDRTLRIFTNVRPEEFLEQIKEELS